MAGSNQGTSRLLAEIARLRERIAELETKLKYNSAVYSEGGSGEYVNAPAAYNRFEPVRDA